MAEENANLVRHVIEQVFNQGAIDRLGDYMSEAIVAHNPPPGFEPTLDGFKRRIVMLRTAFPDFHYTIEDLIDGGDTIVLRVTAQGTHQGRLGPFPPTGRKAAWPEVHIMRLRTGKLVEHWRVGDDLGQLQQLGLLPSPGHGRPEEKLSAP